MKYCSDCGTGHDCTEAPERVAPEVEIARITAKRDVEVAKINRGERADFNEHMDTSTEAEVEIATIEAEAGVEAAEAVAEALTEVLAPDQPEAAPAAAPAIVVDDQVEGDEPPPREEREHDSSEPSEPNVKKGFF